MFSLFVVSIVFNNESTEGGRRLQIQKCKPVNVKSSMTERTCCEHMALLRQVAYTQPAYRGTVMTHACTRLYRPTISECAWVRNAACCRPLSSGTSCARLETSGTIPSGYNGPLVPRIVRRLHYTRRRPSKLHASAPSTRTRDCILDMLKGIYIYIYICLCVYIHIWSERCILESVSGYVGVVQQYRCVDAIQRQALGIIIRRLGIVLLLRLVVIIQA